MIIAKSSSTTVAITSVGQVGVVSIPYPEIPDGYVPFLTIPSSGTPNLLVAFSQHTPYYQLGTFPIRYIGYQMGAAWPIGISCYYIRKDMLNIQT